MNPTRRGFLAGSAALSTLAALGLPGIAAAAGSAKRLVLVHATGGWDVTYALDPKEGVAEVDGPDLDEDGNNPDDREAVQTFGATPVMVNPTKRPAVSAFFRRWGDRTAVLNGVWVGSIAHTPCSIRMLTGARTEAHADLAAITGATVGLDTPIPYMDLSGVGYAGALAAYSGRTGARNQLELLLDRSTRIRGPSGTDQSYPGFVPADPDRAALRAFLEKREAHLRLGDQAASMTRFDDLVESRSRAALLLDEGAGFADSLQIGRQSDLTTMAPTVRSLLSSGLCHTVSISAGAEFDTHQDNSDQHAEWDLTFTGLDALMTELVAGGLIDDTVVVVVSEMTRTPRRNADGGKDHWPVTSALVLGGGVAGGRVYGGTTDLLDGVPVDLQSGERFAGGTVPGYDNLAAGVLDLVGVDSEEWLPGVEPYRGFHA